jgi:hypothetical protein
MDTALIVIGGWFGMGILVGLLFGALCRAGDREARSVQDSTSDIEFLNSAKRG